LIRLLTRILLILSWVWHWASTLIWLEAWALVKTTTLSLLPSAIKLATIWTSTTILILAKAETFLATTVVHHLSAHTHLTILTIV
jgi:hypothetical protein